MASVTEGARVRLDGLKGAAHLNGQEGSCVSFDSAAGRWVVRLDSGEQKSLKPDNLVVLKSVVTNYLKPNNLVVLKSGKGRSDGNTVSNAVAADDEAQEDGGRMTSDQDSGFVLCPSLAAARQAVGDGELKLEFGRVPAEELTECVAFVCDELLAGSSGIRGLSFASCGLAAEHISRLATAVQGSEAALVALGVSKNPGVESDVWRSLFQAIPEKVVWLDFGDNQLKDEGVAPLVNRLAGREELDKLYLDGNGLTDLSALAAALPDTGITQLDLGDNSIGDDDAPCLARALSKSVVMVLVLGQNPLGPLGSRAIMEQLARSSVDTLYLNDTGADDQCLQTLGLIAADAKLSELHLDSTSISDAGVKTFIEQLEGSQLNYLDISGNDISDETAALLEKVLAEQKDSPDLEAIVEDMD